MFACNVLQNHRQLLISMLNVQRVKAICISTVSGTKQVGKMQFQIATRMVNLQIQAQIGIKFITDKLYNLSDLPGETWAKPPFFSKRARLAAPKTPS